MVSAQMIMEIGMCAARKRNALCGMAAVWAAWAVPAWAEMRIEAAKITGGDLWVIGYADDPDVEITLDGRYPQRTDSSPPRCETNSSKPTLKPLVTADHFGPWALSALMTLSVISTRGLENNTTSPCRIKSNFSLSKICLTALFARSTIDAVSSFLR